MSSCIRVLYLTLFASFFASGPLAVGADLQVGPQRDPDALYRDRENLASAREAASLWATRVETNATDFESWWKLARAYYWLGGHGPQESRREDLERGVAAAERAAALAVNRPEGHFWKAANMGALAESFGLGQGMKYRGAIRESLETVLKLDAGFQQGSADRALGRWYFKVPGFFGGSRKKSEEHLRKSLTYNANSNSSRFFLAETLFSMDRDGEAVRELNTILAAPIDPEWAPEDREFKQKARDLLSARSPR
jgi:tetratricopeptide (TPR) repeat protein